MTTVTVLSPGALHGQVDFVRSVTAGDQLREEEHALLETLVATVPLSRTVKSNSLEITPSNTPQLSPATTPANKKNRLPIGTTAPHPPRWCGAALAEGELGSSGL